MDVVLRTIFAFLFLVVLFRVMGRRELSSLEPFDLILIVVIGDLIQQGVTQNDLSFTGIFLSVGTFALLTVMLSFLTAKVRWLRPVIEARPIIVVALLAGCGSSTPAKQAEDLESLAAEGALLAHDVAEGETTGPFTRVHSRELAHAAKSLESSAKTPEIEQLAGEIYGELNELGDADRHKAAQIEDELHGLADDAGDLA